MGDVPNTIPPRDQLLGSYQRQSIGFADGAVVAAAPAPLEVFLAINQLSRIRSLFAWDTKTSLGIGIRRNSFPFDAA